VGALHCGRAVTASGSHVPRCRRLRRLKSYLPCQRGEKRRFEMLIYSHVNSAFSPPFFATLAASPTLFPIRQRVARMKRSENPGPVSRLRFPLSGLRVWRGQTHEYLPLFGVAHGHALFISGGRTAGGGGCG